jgi:hypothetical protein
MRDIIDFNVEIKGARLGAHQRNIGAAPRKTARLRIHRLRKIERYVRACLGCEGITGEAHRVKTTYVERIYST